MRATSESTYFVLYYCYKCRTLPDIHPHGAAGCVGTFALEARFRRLAVGNKATSFGQQPCEEELNEQSEKA